MKKKINALSLLTFAMALLSGGSMIFIIAAVHVYKTELFMNEDPLSLAGAIVFICFSLVFLFMLISFIWQVALLRRLNRASVGKTILLIFGVFSLFLFIGDKMMIDEIGREMKLGWETLGESLILTAMLVCQLIYILTILCVLAKNSGRERETEEGNPIQEENVFTIAQVTGVACGLVGLSINFGFFLKQRQIGEAAILVPFYVLILLPYGLVVLYWISMRRKLPLSLWYDEKQWRDVALAGFITLLLSVPGMAGLFLWSKPFGFFWFPHYVFLIITLFSASTLYLFRQPR